jgi:hypothetical protein
LLLSDTLAEKCAVLVHFLLFCAVGSPNHWICSRLLLPVNNLLNQILWRQFRNPGLVLIGFVGWLLAQVVQRIVTNLLAQGRTV